MSDLLNKTIFLFGCEMNVLTMRETVDLIDGRMSRGEFTQHSVVNVAKIVNMQTDKKLANSVASCHIVNIDGMGVVWAARALGYTVSERVSGIDLFHKIMELACERGISIYFLGATSDVVKLAVEKCVAQYKNIKIAGFRNGYFSRDEENSVVEDIRISGAKILFVAISSPYKENFINRWKESLGADFVMGVGGTFDVVAGKVRRAPLWMQLSGLEWAYRVMQEPRRMMRRYLVTNSKFALMLLAEKIGRFLGR
ncbi:WecB/TagA/CpsF family glycosyltransferase [Paraburkholderia sp. J94]|uniref:WecB/TagA/CpsF family glycosyltransferase n=1 Tax=Paraburkholderia sp. J94 TaxID=2805441 RepID=UPI002AB3145A|nr:WecB/TagA/CpsF family glycosyltransferase [Paraburkholderia sp. J94]